MKIKLFAQDTKSIQQQMMKVLCKN